MFFSRIPYRRVTEAQFNPTSLGKDGIFRFGSPAPGGHRQNGFGDDHSQVILISLGSPKAKPESGTWAQITYSGVVREPREEDAEERWDREVRTAAGRAWEEWTTGALCRDPQRSRRHPQDVLVQAGWLEAFTHRLPSPAAGGACWRKPPRGEGSHRDLRSEAGLGLQPPESPDVPGLPGGTSTSCSGPGALGTLSLICLSAFLGVLILLTAKGISLGTSISSPSS